MNHRLNLFNDSDSARLSDFLAKNSITDYKVEPIGEDMAPRRYYRLKASGIDAPIILCVSVPDAHPDAHPGSLIKNTISISRQLAAQGIKAPHVIDADPEQGFVLLDDFGDIRFDQAIKRGLLNKEEAYCLAAEVSQKIQNLTPLDTLPNYYESYVHTARGRLVEWYLPIASQQRQDPALIAEYLALWDQVEQSAAPQKLVFSHIDFHLMNLMYLPDEEGTDRCGVLDFQGAMKASYAYDLVNLLGDARRLVDPALKAQIIDGFTADMSADERRDFDDHYAILSAQFHSRCLGQFIQLAFMGKPQYLDYIPGLLQQFKADMDAPILKPIYEWLLAHNMDFDKAVQVDMQRDGAFVGCG
jgi:aminoglycoside/choline kinase family phosphotransferase